MRRRPAPAAAAPPVTLARVLERRGDTFVVRAGGAERIVACDPAVDPALVEEAMASGGRVVLDGDVIAGALATARAVQIGRDGAVDARVARFRVTAREDLTLRSVGAFLRLTGADAELYGTRVLARGRELVKVLGRMVKLN